MSLSHAQITRLKSLIEMHTTAQTDKAFSGSLSREEQADCRDHAKKAEEALNKYIDGLAIVPRRKVTPK